MKYIIPIQSISDVITNSSSEVFIIKNEYNIAELEKLLNDNDTRRPEGEPVETDWTGHYGDIWVNSLSKHPEQLERIVGETEMYEDYGFDHCSEELLEAMKTNPDKYLLVDTEMQGESLMPVFDKLNIKVLYYSEP